MQKYNPKKTTLPPVFLAIASHKIFHSTFEGIPYQTHTCPPYEPHSPVPAAPHSRSCLIVLGPFATLRYLPVDVLVGRLDIARLAVDATRKAGHPLAAKRRREKEEGI
jgi:hypothetical protein